MFGVGAASQSSSSHSALRLSSSSRRLAEAELLAQAVDEAVPFDAEILGDARPFAQLDDDRGRRPRASGSNAGSVRKAEVDDSRRRGYVLAPAMVKRSRKLSICWLMAWTPLRSISVSTTGPCGTSIAARI